MGAGQTEEPLAKAKEPITVAEDFRDVGNVRDRARCGGERLARGFDCRRISASSKGSSYDADSGPPLLARRTKAAALVCGGRTRRYDFAAPPASQAGGGRSLCVSERHKDRGDNRC